MFDNINVHFEVQIALNFVFVLLTPYIWQPHVIIIISQ